jgi:arylformamidase
MRKWQTEEEVSMSVFERRLNIQGAQVIDLSQALEPGIPVPPGFPAAQREIFLSQAKGDIANVETLCFSVHTATHCDAPYHFFSELRTVDALPPDCLIGPAIVVNLVDGAGSRPIEDQEIQQWEAASGEEIQPGDIVLLHTGHSQRWQLGDGAPAYWQDGWPHLARSAVDYLAGKPIRAIGVESFDPDWVDLHNLTSAQFLAHRTFLPKGILIMETLTNLDRITGRRCQIIALPLKLKGCSGSPIRVIAIVALVIVSATPADSNRRVIAKVRSSALNAGPTRFSGFRISDTGFNRWPKR